MSDLLLGSDEEANSTRILIEYTSAGTCVRSGAWIRWGPDANLYAMLRGRRAEHAHTTRMHAGTRALLGAVAVLTMMLVWVPTANAEPDLEPDDLAGAAKRAQEQLVEIEGRQDQAQAVLDTLEAELTQLEQTLAQAQTVWVAAIEKLEAAKVRADELQVAAEAAAATAAAAEAELLESLRRMYVRPPQSDQAAVMGASNLEDQMQMQAVLSVQSTQRHELMRQARTARRLADTRRDDAERARRTAESEERTAEAAAAELEAARTELNTEMSYAGEFLSALQVQHADVAATAADLATRAALQEAARNVYVDTASIVRIPGTTISVHPLIAVNAIALVEAALADGVQLNGWGWRSTQRQIELRQSHCGSDAFSIFEKPSNTCSPPTARPGRSMHERGLAIDFANCSARSTGCFRWLAANAARFGFYNLPSEPWHWSTNGN